MEVAKPATANGEPAIAVSAPVEGFSLKAEILPNKESLAEP
jgi:hypothetical protein